MFYKGIEIKKINHAAIKVKSGGLVVYFDPFMLGDEKEKADIIFISHEHFDHCSPEDIAKIITSATVIVTIPMAAEKLKSFNQEIRLVMPGETGETKGVKFEAAPAYNVNKFRSPGVPFHPLQDGKVGFVVDFSGIRVYHAGDTDFIPEMKNLKDIDVALLPVSGIFVMTAEEAAAAAGVIRPQIAVPMHYGDYIFDGKSLGVKTDAEEFKRLCPVRVEII